ncbi:MAG: hypothetical protein S4CHLAM2_03000 [Chlamydiales bacterium]|nr:hypothetical protein [Chlamydiales bacterium]
MTRTSKQEERRARSPRKHKKPSVKTGPKKDNLPSGYKEHANALSTEANVFIPKVK